MPMMADLDDPPSPRWRFLLVGFAIALPLGALFLSFALPALRMAIVGGAESLDARLRVEDAYMKGVCTEALVLERDESLCKCALAVEFPSLDCRQPFMRWSIERQHEQCSSGADETAIAFCACVESLLSQIGAVDLTGPSKDQRLIIGRYPACAELQDALFLPEIASLAAPDDERAAAVQTR